MVGKDQSATRKIDRPCRLPARKRNVPPDSGAQKSSHSTKAAPSSIAPSQRLRNIAALQSGKASKVHELRTLTCSSRRAGPSAMETRSRGSWRAAGADAPCRRPTFIFSVSSGKTIVTRRWRFLSNTPGCRGRHGRIRCGPHACGLGPFTVTFAASSPPRRLASDGVS